MIDPDIPAPVVQAVVASWGIIAIRKLEAGLSGGTVAHCRSADGQEYALKRWPSSTSPERIESIHRVVIHACNQAGVSMRTASKSINPVAWPSENRTC